MKGHCIHLKCVRPCQYEPSTSPWYPILGAEGPWTVLQHLHLSVWHSTKEQNGTKKPIIIRDSPMSAQPGSIQAEIAWPAK